MSTSTAKDFDVCRPAFRRLFGFSVPHGGAFQPRGAQHKRSFLQLHLHMFEACRHSTHSLGIPTVGRSNQCHPVKWQEQVSIPSPRTGEKLAEGRMRGFPHLNGPPTLTVSPKQGETGRLDTSSGHDSMQTRLTRESAALRARPRRSAGSHGLGSGRSVSCDRCPAGTTAWRGSRSRGRCFRPLRSRVRRWRRE